MISPLKCCDIVDGGVCCRTCAGRSSACHLAHHVHEGRELRLLRLQLRCEGLELGVCRQLLRVQLLLKLGIEFSIIKCMLGLRLRSEERLRLRSELRVAELVVGLQGRRCSRRRALNLSWSYHSVDRALLLWLVDCRGWKSRRALATSGV